MATEPVPQYARPKEQEIIDIYREEKAAGRKVLIYSVYIGTCDTSLRLKALLL
jgi:hypothetical protein